MKILYRVKRFQGFKSSQNQGWGLEFNQFKDPGLGLAFRHKVTLNPKPQTLNPRVWNLELGISCLGCRARV